MQVVASLSLAQPISLDQLREVSASVDKVVGTTAAYYPFTDGTTFYSTYSPREDESIDEVIDSWVMHMQADLQQSLATPTDIGPSPTVPDAPSSQDAGAAPTGGVDDADRQEVQEILDRIASYEIPIVRLEVAGEGDDLVDAIRGVGAEPAYFAVGGPGTRARLIDDPATEAVISDACGDGN